MHFMQGESFGRFLLRQGFLDSSLLAVGHVSLKHCSQLWVCGDILFCVIFGPFSGIQSLGPARSCGPAATFFFFAHFRPFFWNPESRPSPQLWVCGDILLFCSFSVLFPESGLAVSGPRKPPI
jgi:hypothetical protein